MAINFPNPATLNQTYTVGTKTWVYNGYAWDLVLANTAPILSVASMAFTQANTGVTIGQASFTQANTGVTIATAAFARANTETIGQASFTQANTGVTIAQAAFTQANTGVTIAQAAYSTANTKFSSSGGTISGSVTITTDLNVTGNVYLGGNVTTLSSNNLSINDPLIYLAQNNPGNLQDIGVVGHFTSGTYQHTGFARDATDGIWKLFSNVAVEPTTTIDFTNAIYDVLQVGTVNSSNANFTVATGTAPLTVSSTTVVSNLNADYLDGQHGSYYTGLTGSAWDTANTGVTIATAAFARANTETIGQAAFTQANTGVTIAQAGFTQANTGVTIGQAGFTQANTGVTIGQAAFGVANTGVTIAQAGFTQANTKFSSSGGTITGNTTVIGVVTGNTFVSTIATGTAPLTVSSTTVVSNLNADYLDGQHGTYYTTAGNLSGTIPSAVLGNSTQYIGTTAVTLNRASASLALTGITSIDSGATSLSFQTNSNTRITLDSSGNTGIGTTAPVSKLHVQALGASNGTINSRTGLHIQNANITTGTASARIQFSFDPATPKAWIEAGVYGSDYLAFGASAGATENMRLDSSGNLGINSASPYAKLEVANNGPQNVAWLKNFGGTRSSPTEISDWPWPVLALSSYGNYYRQTMMSFTLPNDASASNGIYHTDDSIWNIKLNGVTSTGWDNNSNTTPSVATSANVGLELLGPGNLRLGSVNAKNIYLRTNNTDQVTIDPTGLVGIGTTSPQAKLHVTGAIYSSILTAPNYVLNSSGSNYGFIQNDSANKWSLSSGTSPSTLGTPALTWNSSGDVGIGTTAPGYKLDVVTTNVRFQSGTSETAIVLGPQTNQGYVYGNSTAMGFYSGTTGANIALNKDTNNAGVFISSGTGAYVIGFDTAATRRMTIFGNGNVAIGTGTDSGYKLQVNGSFAATTKSFVIDHPTKPDMKLRYGSLEGPENGVYVRGRLKDSNVIELPDYWTGLVDESTITVNLTAIGKSQDLWVDDIIDNTVIVGGSNINCFYTVFAERKDVEKLVVEF